MKARNFRYIRPESVDQAYRILAEHDGDAVSLAGGPSLLATLNMRLSCRCTGYHTIVEALEAVLALRRRG